MLKRTLLSGALGFVVLVIWTFVANGVFGFANRVEMNRVPDEQRVHAMLEETITEPGAYVVNPQPVPDTGFPAGTALLLAGNTVVAWTLMGLAMAWSMRPPRDAVSGQ